MSKVPVISYRRHFLKCGVTHIGFLSGLVANTTLANSSMGLSGCCLMSGGESFIAQSRLGNITGGMDRIESSGNSRFDLSLGAVLADLASKFKVRPGFGYFDDRGTPNAIALPISQLAFSQGTVLFGREMLAQAMKNIYGDMFVMGICAHEFAHIVQFFSGFYERLTTGRKTKKLLELHADFLSGYYIGLRNINYSSSELIALGRSWELLGDSNFTDPHHHGTQEERISALEQGYKLARLRPEFGIQAACEVGFRYLNALKS